VRLALREIAGFAVIVGAFVVLMALLDLEPQSWASFALLAVFFAVLLGYRSYLRRRHG
jgi:hypothetical protein